VLPPVKELAWITGLGAQRHLAHHSCDQVSDPWPNLSRQPYGTVSSQGPIYALSLLRFAGL